MTAPFGGDLEALFQEMQRLQGQFAAAESASRATEVEGRAGGGVVKVRASGEFEFRSIEIDPALLESRDTALLEDLVLAAVRDATTQLIAVRQAAVREAVGGSLAALLDNSDEDDASAPGADETD